MPAVASRLHLHMAQAAPEAAFVARSARYGRRNWYRRVDYVSIITVTSGAGWLGLGGGPGRAKFETLTVGRVFLLRPTDVTLILGADTGGVGIAWVSSPTASWRAFAGLAGLDPSWATTPYPPHSTIDPDDPDGIPAFERAIERFRQDPSVFDLIRFWTSVTPKLLPLAPRRSRGPAGVPRWLLDGLETMRQEENLRGGVARLLELTHVSGPHLAALTRRYYGQTPTELVSELRLLHAADLLRQTSDPIGSIAERCGYSSLVYFSGRFRQGFGISPREYRGSLGNGQENTPDRIIRDLTAPIPPS